MQAAAEAERDRVTSQLQDSIVAAEVGRAKALLYDELAAKADKLVRWRVRGNGTARWQRLLLCPVRRVCTSTVCDGRICKPCTRAPRTACVLLLLARWLRTPTPTARSLTSRGWRASRPWSSGCGRSWRTPTPRWQSGTLPCSC
jgi:hypothetical protein